MLDYTTFLRRGEKVSSDLPLIIEHLTDEAKFDEAAGYIRRVAGQTDTSV